MTKRSSSSSRRRRYSRIHNAKMRAILYHRMILNQHLTRGAHIYTRATIYYGTSWLSRASSRCSNNCANAARLPAYVRREREPIGNCSPARDGRASLCAPRYMRVSTLYMCTQRGRRASLYLLSCLAIIKC